MADNAWLLAEPIIVIVVLSAIGLLLFYGVIRAGIAHGLRDHHRWMENNRPAVNSDRVNGRSF